MGKHFSIYFAPAQIQGIGWYNGTSCLAEESNIVMYVALFLCNEPPKSNNATTAAAAASSSRLERESNGK